MRHRIPVFVVAVAAVCVLLGSVQRPEGGSDAVLAFGRLPVLAEGRIKPLDSVARSTLLVIQGRQRVMRADRTELTPDEWLLDVFYAPEKADTYRVFVVDNPDLLSLIGKNDENLAIHYDKAAEQVMALIGFLPSRQRRMSFSEIAPYLQQIEAQEKLAEPVEAQSRTRFLQQIEAQEKLAEPVEAQSRTRFQSAVVQLYGNLSHYLRLRRALAPEGTRDFLGELLHLQESLSDGVEAVRAKEAGKPHDEAKAAALIAEGQKFIGMAESTDLLAIPPDDGAADPNAWHTDGHALLESFGQGFVSPPVLAYAGMGYAWRNHEAPSFAHIVQMYGSGLEKRFGPQVRKARIETVFNAAQPFYAAMIIYLCAFLCAVLSWLKWPEPARGSARGVGALGWGGTAGGVAARTGGDT